MDTLLQDLRYGLRSLIRNPIFAVVAILTLGVGIGATTAVFGLIHAVLLRPLQAKDPKQLVAVYAFQPKESRLSGLSYPDWKDYRDHEDGLSGMALYCRTPFHLAMDRQTERVHGEMVTSNYFSVLGIEPILGRTFASDGGDAGRSVLVLSHRLWQRIFDSAPTVLGKVVSLNGHSFTVIGVLPSGFSGVLLDWYLEADVWVPMLAARRLHTGFPFDSTRGMRVLPGVGRLEGGYSLLQAEAFLQSTSSALERQYPETNRGWTVKLYPLSRARFWPPDRRSVVEALGLLFADAGLVLVIACTNVAGLLVVRSWARRREMAIRLALGCRRKRLVFQLLTETGLLYLPGAALGLLLGSWIYDLLRLFPAPLGKPLALELRLDPAVLGFCLLVSLLTATLFGLLPVFQTSRPNLVEFLKERGAATKTTHLGSAFRSLFVVLQIAISLVLLVGAGLLSRSLHNARSTDPGFKSQNVLLLSIDLENQGYSQSQKIRFYRDLWERVGNLPGVAKTSWASHIPFATSAIGFSLEIPGADPLNGDSPKVSGNIVSPGYFSTLEIPLLQGRDFQDVEGDESPSAVIINQSMAGRWWPDEDVIGRHIRIGDTPHRIVGVVGDIKHFRRDEPSLPFLYTSRFQSAEGDATLQVAASGDPKTLVRSVRSVIESLDRRLPVYGVMTLEEALEDALSQTRALSWTLTLSGCFGLLLALMGIYGTMAYSVAQRTREIGMRIALGAERWDILRRIMGRGVGLASIGVVLGLLTALLLTRFLSNLLLDVDPKDPAILAVVSLLLVMASSVACYIPARRASRIEPMEVLHYE